MSNDLVADLLTRIRNAQRAGHRTVQVSRSKMVERVLEVLRGEGFIGDVRPVPVEDTSFEDLEVMLKYYPDGKPVISSCRRVSKSGRRMYAGSEKISKIRSGLGIAIVSTSQGVMSDREARRRQIGGEVIAAVS